MRLLHLYAGNLFGGIERMLLTLASESPRDPRLRHSFGLCFDGPLARQLAATGADVRLLGAVRFSRPWTLWRARRNLRGLLRRERLDVVVSHACWPHAVFAPAARAAGRPLALWAHDAMDASARFERRAARHRPDLVIANSHFTARTVGTTFPGVGVRVVHCLLTMPPPLSLPERAIGRARWGLMADDRVVAICARLEPTKGHANLLEAFALLPTPPGKPLPQLWVIGGAQRPHEHAHLRSLQQLAEQLGIADRVRWFGQRDDARELVALADVLCQPNTSPDSFGLSLVESLAAGVPVVTSDLGGPREIVRDDCGTLVDAGNARGIAAALGHWLSRAGEPGLADRARARAVELCDPAARLADLADALATIAAAGQPLPAGPR